MAKLAFQGNEVNTNGEIPKVGDMLKGFSLVNKDLTEITLDDYKGKIKILNIFPSLDTGVCANSVKSLNEKKAGLNDNVVVLNISQDLPFAQSRFCTAENTDNTDTLSAFRSSFSKDYGLEIIDSPLKGLASRVLLVADENNKIIYSEQVKEITDSVHFDDAIVSIS